jgi:hypothetical protein
MESMRSSKLPAAMAVIALTICATVLMDSGTDSLVSVVGSALGIIHTADAPATLDGGILITTPEFFLPYVSPENSVLPVWSKGLDLVDRALVPFVSVGLVGGLPFAMIALIARRIRRVGSALERVFASVAVCHVCLLSQIASILVSAFLLMPAVWFAPSWHDVVETWPYIGYLGAQILAGSVALPTWRVLLDRASRTRLNTRFLRAA